MNDIRCFEALNIGMSANDLTSDMGTSTIEQMINIQHENHPCLINDNGKLLKFDDYVPLFNTDIEDINRKFKCNVRCMIDTGASISCMDEKYFNNNLINIFQICGHAPVAPVGSGKDKIADRPVTKARIYMGKIVFEKYFTIIPLNTDVCNLLIGRDILSHFNLQYFGKANESNLLEA